MASTSVLQQSIPFTIPHVIFFQLKAHHFPLIIYIGVNKAACSRSYWKLLLFPSVLGLLRHGVASHWDQHQRAWKACCMRKRISMYQSLYTLFNYILPIKINPLPTHFRFLDLDVIHLNRQITLQAYSSGRGRLTHVSSGIKIGSTNIDSFYRTCSHICHSFLVLVPFKSRDLLSLGPPQKLCIE